MKKTISRSGMTILLVLMLAAALSGNVQAVHDDDIFQLDYVTSPPAHGAANVSSTNISPAGNDGDDWDNVYNSVTGLGSAGPSSAFANSWVADGVSTAEVSFFTGGGSKDTNDIPQWLYDTTNDVVPDKDDIEHAFAAAYERPDDGHVIVYFGADRFDAGDGSAELGFWFFRDDVTLNPLAPNATTGTFNGTHRIGDLLVLVEFVRGGDVGQVNVYEWDGAGGDNLALLLTENAADCATIDANDDACAVINTIAGETPPWPYINKDGGTSYQQFALFEGGIDFTALLGGDIGCFSSFMAETRSSGSSVQAQLKDFALGAFPICGIAVDKTGNLLSKIGDPVNYTVTITNTGKATLYKRNISDTVLGDVTIDGVDQVNSYVTGNTCGASLAPNASCTVTFTRTVQAGDPDPLPNTVSILYSEFADFSGLEFDDDDDHEVNLFQPAVMIEKEGDELSKVTDLVTYTFTITNKSSEDSPDLVLASISDNVIGDLSADANTAGCDVLTFEEECSFSVSRTVDEADPDPLVNTVDVLYHPAGFPNDITASDGHSVNLFQPAVSITKDGDELSKIGDEVTYTVTITNTSSADSPNLVLDSISDDVLGDLSDEAPAECDSLAPGDSCNFDVPWTVAAVDVNPADGDADDPVINTVTIHFHPDGFTNDITATASHELNLFQPSIAFSKTADTELSKATDTVKYTLTLNNTSSVDTPDLECSISDARLGVDKSVTLASGEGDVTQVDYVVQAGDPDPLVNNASVSCSPEGFPNVLTANDSWTVNLFQPSVEIVKGGDELSKIGDQVTYTFVINNTSSADSPDLKLDSLSDTVLGDLLAAATAAGCDNLAPGASCNFAMNYTIQETDTDPLPNTVTVHYHPVGFTNDIADSDDHAVNLFQPSITFTKEGDALSKIGDEVTYTLTLTNTSSADTPTLNCTVTDTLLGLDTDVSLGTGGQSVITKGFIIPAGADDPFVNTASVACSPAGFPNVLTASDGHEINLFQPSIEVTKTGPAYTKAGDTNTYEVTVSNTSSADTPELVDGTLVDSLAGDLLDAANTAVQSSDCDGSLAFGESCTVTYEYITQAADADPLVNEVEAHFNPDGFPNDISDSAQHSSDVLHPAFDVTKACKADTEPIPQEGPAIFTITFDNTGDADLHVVPSEGAPFDVAAGGSHSYDYSVDGPFSGQATISNTVTGTVTLDEQYGLDNSYTFEETGSCDVGSRVELLKRTNGVVNPTYDWDFAIWNGPHFGDPSTWLSDPPLATDSTLGDADGILTFGLLNLDPTKTYTICELATNASAGWTQLWTINGMTVPAYNPGQFDNPMQSLGYSCVDFGAGTGYDLTAGGTLRIELDNDFPGGEPRTPGYWKNWNSCTGGGQYPKTIDANDPDNEFWSLDELLNNPGFDVGTMHLDGIWDNDKYKYQNAPYNNDCVEAVYILDKSDAGNGRKQANDAAYELATAYFASLLNYAAGAEQCSAADDAQIAAQTLLLSISFDGDGSFLGPRVKNGLLIKRNQALQLATTLDLYNNGLICSP